MGCSPQEAKDRTRLKRLNMNVRQYLDIVGNPTFDEKEKKGGKGKKGRKGGREREGEEERKARFSDVATSGPPGNGIFVRNSFSDEMYSELQAFAHRNPGAQTWVLPCSLSEFPGRVVWDSSAETRAVSFARAVIAQFRAWCFLSGLALTPS